MLKAREESEREEEREGGGEQVVCVEVEWVRAEPLASRMPDVTEEVDELGDTGRQLGSLSWKSGTKGLAYSAQENDRAREAPIKGVVGLNRLSSNRDGFCWGVGGGGGTKAERAGKLMFWSEVDNPEAWVAEEIMRWDQ